MATSYYSTGTVTLTNGSAVVTGNGTGWELALIAGGNVIVQATGNLLPIASVDTDSQITSELEWTGASGEYSYTIQRDTAYLQTLDANSQNLSYLLSELRAGTIFKYDQSGDLAGRSLYDARPKNFGYLVTIGVSQPVFYVKASNTDGDWAGPFPYGTGPQGDQGPGGPFTEITIGPTTTLPAGSAAEVTVVPVDADTVRLDFSLPKGQDGTGVGDMVKATYDPQDKQADAFDRANHTGTQAVSTITGLDSLPDTSLVLADPGNATKKGRFDVGAVTAGQSRIYSLPNHDFNIDGYELFGQPIDLAGVSFAQWTGLGTLFSDIKIVVGGLPASGAGSAFIRVSQDNGATWDSGAADYNYATGLFSGATVSAAAPATNSFFQLSASLGGAEARFEIDVNNFNAARPSLIVADGVYFQFTGLTFQRLLNQGYHAYSRANNAIMFGVTNGLAFTGGVARLFGLRK